MKLNILAFWYAFNGFCGDGSGLSFTISRGGELPPVEPAQQNQGMAGAFLGIAGGM